MTSDESFGTAQDSSRGSTGSPSLGPSRAQPREAASRDESFQKKEHILKSKDFRKAYKKGLMAKRESLVLYCLPNGLGYSRIGFSISSKSVRRATRRARMRRRLKEIYRRNKRNFKSGFDMVIVAKKDFPKTASYKDIENLYLKLARDTKIFI